jgi:hypothetical protein
VSKDKLAQLDEFEEVRGCIALPPPSPPRSRAIDVDPLGVRLHSVIFPFFAQTMARLLAFAAALACAQAAQYVTT